MIILGLDPGIARTGFGVLDTTKPQSYICCGCLTTPAHQPTADRLLTLGQNLNTLINKYKPNKAVIEKIFFGNNSKTAILTAQARGVMLYILREHNIITESLTPLQIKSQLTGYGQADKKQMQQMIMRRLNLNSIPQPDDAADALAAALCSINPKQTLQKSTTHASLTHH
jgi:crossover junction endodeoxyribonuclease RuvC